jgi:hypothetical protein
MDGVTSFSKAPHLQDCRLPVNKSLHLINANGDGHFDTPIDFISELDQRVVFSPILWGRGSFPSFDQIHMVFRVVSK